MQSPSNFSCGIANHCARCMENDARQACLRSQTWIPTAAASDRTIRHASSRNPCQLVRKSTSSMREQSYDKTCRRLASSGDLEIPILVFVRNVSLLVIPSIQRKPWSATCVMTAIPLLQMHASGKIDASLITQKSCFKKLTQRS